jgi:hypothetical protein
MPRAVLEFGAELQMRVFVSRFLFLLFSCKKYFVGTPNIARCGPCMLWHFFSPRAKLALAKRNDPEQPWGLAAPQPHDVMMPWDQSLADLFFRDLEDDSSDHPAE